MLDERLQLCADFVSDGGVVCDIGTDHAYLVAQLILSGKCKRAIAADVADGPLLFAKQTLSKYDISSSVKLIKSNGFESITDDGITDIVIAGMGGELIYELISKCEWIKLGKRLILQPMSKPEVLRRSLYASGYEILEEKAVCADNHIYSVMLTQYSGKLQSEVPLQLEWLGKLTRDDAVYINDLKRRQLRIIEGLETAGKFEEAENHRKIVEMIDNFMEG